MTTAIVTQETTELLSESDINARVSQEAVEVLSGGAVGDRTSQFVIEVLASDEQITIRDRVTQGVVEVLSELPVNDRISQFVVEVLYPEPPLQWLYLDSCQRCATADLAYAYTVSGSVIVTTTYKRARQSQSYRLAEDAFLSKPVPNGGSSAFIGAAVRLGSYPASEKPVLRFMEGSDEVVGLHLLSDGRIRVRTGSTVHATSATAVVGATRFFYLELEILIDDTAGRVRAWVDGALICEVLDTDTELTTNAWIDSARWYGAASTYTYMTSLYYKSYLDTQPSGVPFGNCEIHPRVPVRDHGNAGMIPSAGVNLFNVVDEAKPITVDYISGSSGNQYSLDSAPFTYPNVNGDNRILGVQTVFLARDDQSPDANLKSKAVSGDQSIAGLATYQLVAEADWKFVEEGYLINPLTSQPWTDSSVNAMAFGGQL